MSSFLKMSSLVISLFIITANAYAVDKKVLEKLLNTPGGKTTFVGKIDVSENVPHDQYPLIFISGKSSIFIVTDIKNTVHKIGLIVDLELHLDHHEWSNAPFAGVERHAYSVKIANKKAFQEYAIIGNYDPLTKKERKKIVDSGYKLAKNYVVAAYSRIHGIENDKKTYIIYAEATNQQLANALSKDSYSDKKREWLNTFEQRFIKKSGLGRIFPNALSRHPEKRIFSRTEKTGFAGFGHRILCSDHDEC